MLVNTHQVAIAIALLLSSVGSLTAQGQPAAQDPPAQQPAPADRQMAGLGQGAAEPLAAAEKSLKENGFVEGYNKKADRFIAIGTGSLAEVKIEPGVTDLEEFANRRIGAFGIAMASAKQRLAEFVAAEISSAVKTSYVEPDVGAQLVAAIPGAARVKSLVDKEASGEAKRPALLASDEFSSAVKVVAAQEIGALQAFQTFEQVDAGGKAGTIVVIAMLSPNSKKMQAAMMGRGGLVKGDSQGSVEEWVDSVAAQGRMMFTQGVVQRVDENGEVTLVAFSQASPRLNSRRAQEVSRDKAIAQAQQMLRQFAGELVASDVERTVGYSLKDFADGSQQYLNSSAFQASVNAIAKDLALPGNACKKTVYEVHPATGQSLTSVAVAWNVSSVLAANELKASLDKNAGSRGGAGLSGVQQKPAEKPKVGPDGKPEAPATPASPTKPTPPKRPTSGAGGTGSGG